MAKIKREKIQTINIRNEIRDITTDLAATKRLMKEYYEEPCAHELSNLEEGTNIDQRMTVVQS